MHPSYALLRKDVLQLIEPRPGLAVLDVGCSTGINGSYLKNALGATVMGIDYDETCCREAGSRLDRVFQIDLNVARLSSLPFEWQFDYIIFADILEHLVKPWEVLSEGTSLLKPGGRIVASIPNVGHWSTISSLAFRGVWPTAARGIHDINHLRFFTRKSLVAMYDACGLDIECEKRNLRLLERGTRLDSWRVIGTVLDVPLWRRYFVFQYVHLLRKRSA